MSGRRDNTQNVLDPKDLPGPLQATAFRAVRFQEVDPMGVAWHGRYPEYLEDGRCAVAKAYGLDYEDFFREGLKAPVVRLEVEYRQPLLMGQKFRIETSLLWTEAVRLNHHYVLRRESDGRVVTEARTVQLLLDFDDKLLLLWPPYFQKLREKWKNGLLGRVNV
jgi:acyl-CoA thioester hydrolase